MKKNLKFRASLLATTVLATLGILLFLINWRQRNIYIPLSELRARLAQRINSGKVSGAYLLKVSGNCNLSDYGIFVPGVVGGESLSTLKVSSYLWPKLVAVNKLSGNVAIVTWPGFSSKVIKSSIDGMKSAKTSFESPEYALGRLLVSEGFVATTSREHVRQLVTVAGGMTAVYPENPMPIQELKESEDLEDAMVKLLRHFGGIVIYAECHSRGEGIYDVQYLANDYRSKDSGAN